MQPQTLIIFGASGSGKGTQAQLLIEYLKSKDPEKPTLYIETGQMFREFAEAEAEKTLTGKLTKKIMDHGDLLPEFLPIWIWSEFLIRNVQGREHLVMEGLSRKKDEAPVLDSAMKFYKRDKTAIISIEVSKKWSTEKLLARGRTDDTREDIINRLGWYEAEVTPAIEYFKRDPFYTFISVNGEQTIEKVHADIMEKLDWK